MATDKDLDFTGKTILVTGSGRNIGRAIILEFATRGANVIINSRTNEAEARSVEREAQALGVKTLVVMGAAGELTTVEEMQRRAAATFGRANGTRSSASPARTNSPLPSRSCAPSARARSPAPRSISMGARRCSDSVPCDTACWPPTGEHLGIPILYQKEQRLAFRLF